MNALLNLVPGFAKASIVLKALGITAEETAAADRVVQAFHNAPFVRFLPKDVLPATTAQAIQTVTGLSAVGAGVPSWLVSALDIPQVRTILGAEIERYIMAAPDREQLLSAIGKVAKSLMGETDLDQFPTLTQFIADGFIPAVSAKLAEAKGSSAQTLLHKCRTCGEVQAVHTVGRFTCRFCGSTYVI